MTFIINKTISRWECFEAEFNKRKWLTHKEIKKQQMILF